VRVSRSPVRLIVALSVAGALAIFLLYTAIAGSGTSTIKPSQLTTKVGKVQIVGTVVGPTSADGSSYTARGLRFRMRDIGGKASVPVVYHGDVGALFKPGQNILVTGRLDKGVFVAQRDSMLTKCPSKYLPKKST
jgi:cytochrome c-type biogenesis protein CcmE